MEDYKFWEIINDFEQNLDNHESDPEYYEKCLDEEVSPGLRWLADKSEKWSTELKEATENLKEFDISAIERFLILNFMYFLGHSLRFFSLVNVTYMKYNGSVLWCITCLILHMSLLLVCLFKISLWNQRYLNLVEHKSIALNTSQTINQMFKVMNIMAKWYMDRIDLLFYKEHLEKVNLKNTSTTI